MIRPLPSSAELSSMYEYDPTTGELTRKDSGAPAFVARKNGYRAGMHRGSQFLAHRIIWKLAYGSVPEAIDHINGDRADNRLSNLRDGTNGVNQRNMRLFRNNAIGIAGIHRRADRNSWRALIYVDGRKVELGCFKELADAVAARRAAEAQYGFSARHGT